MQNIKNSTLDKACLYLTVLGIFFFIYSKIWTHCAELGTHPIIVDIATAFFLCSLFLKFVVSFNQIVESAFKNIILWIVLFVASVLYYLFSGSADMIYGALIGFVLQKDKPYELVRSTGYIALIFFIIQLVGFKMGFFYDLNVWTRTDDAFLVRKVREAIGYSHPNHATAYFSPVLIAAAYESPGLRKVFFTVITLIGYIDIYFLTGNRALFILLIAFLCEPLLRKLFKSNVSMFLSCVAYPFFCLISVCIAYIAPSPIGHVLNKLLSSRPEIWHSYICSGSVSAFGSSSLANYLMNDLNQPLDNSYIYILISAGWVFTLVLCVWFAVFLRQACDQNNESLWVIVVITLVYWLSESRFSIGVTVFYPLLFSFVLSNNSLEDNKF